MRTAREDARMTLSGDMLMGLGLLVGSSNRTKNASYAPAKAMTEWLPFYGLRALGALGLLFAVLYFVGLWGERERLMQVGLYASFAYWAWWGCLFAAAALNGRSSFFGPIWGFFWAKRHFVIVKGRPWAEQSG